MIDRHDYPVRIRWTGDKRGVAESPDGLPAVEVATPPEFDGPPGLWSPEHLFVASVTSCLMTSFLAIAGNSKVAVEAFHADAVGTMVRDENRRYRIARVTVRPRVVLAAGTDRERGLRILAKAEEVCLITRSISAEVVLEPTVEVASGAPRAADLQPAHS